MSAFMHDVARASLPVAIALLAFTAVARAALWADDPALVRVGRQYLEPLGVWCLGAVGVQLFAVVAAGDAGALSLLLPIAMGAVLALTPVAALMFRYNNPDAVMVLLMMAAVYCAVRALEHASAKWIALAGVALGFAFLAKMLEGIMVMPAIGLVYPPLQWMSLAFALALLTSVVRATSVVSRIQLQTESHKAWVRFTYRVVITALHLLQPAARLWGRISFGLTPWRRRGTSSFVFPLPRSATSWQETWRSADDRLRELETRLRDSGAIVVRGAGFDGWDLQVRGGLLVNARLLTTIEEHGSGRQLVRIKVWPAGSHWVFTAAPLLFRTLVESEPLRQVLDDSVPDLVLFGAVLLLGEAVRSRRALDLERQKSERLLLNVLPTSIATRPPMLLPTRWARSIPSASIVPTTALAK